MKNDRPTPSAVCALRPPVPGGEEKEVARKKSEARDRRTLDENLLKTREDALHLVAEELSIGLSRPFVVWDIWL